jgi:hypothetical protein
MYAHARLLWNPSQNADQLARAYFAGAFGDRSEQARQYMAKLSELFAPLYLDRETLMGKDGADAKRAALAKLAEVGPTVARFRPVIDGHLSVADPAQRESWKYLSLHANMVLKLAAGLQARVEGNRKAADASWKQLVEQVAEREAETDPVLDIRWFLSTYQDRRLFSPARPARPKAQ